jgi:alcohol dehydrogenase class IV
MHIPPFTLSGFPKVVFGDYTLGQVPQLALEFGRRALVMTGARSFIETPAWPIFRTQLEEAGLHVEHAVVDGEPSPALADRLAAQFRNAGIEVVIGIGGGSVLDAAKAVAGLLRIPNSVMDFLEGVGPELLISPVCRS